MNSIVSIIEFSTWLQREMDRRGWSQAELGREAGLSRGAVGNVLRQEREPGKDFLTGIARAFRMSPDEVFRIAGVLPPQPEEDELTRESEYLFSQLTGEQKTQALNFLKFLVSLQDRIEGGEIGRVSKTTEKTKPSTA